MRRRLFALFAAAILCPVLTWAQATCSPGSSASAPASPSTTSGGGFTTKNGLIYGPNGQPFQARGVNVLWGGNAGGSQGQIFTGQALATENKWYAHIGAAFKNNPDVMFGTNNGQPQMAVGYTPSVYQGMTNVIGDIHYYGWLTNDSTDQATNSNFLAEMIQQTQRLTTASGPMPVIIGEYGPSTTGQDPADANGQQVISAVQSSGVGNVAWAWMTGDVGQDALLSSSGGLTSYGQEVQAYIRASSANSCAGVPAITTPMNTETGPVISSNTGIVPVSPSDVLPSGPLADTQPIDGTASSDGGEYVEIAGPAATDTAPVPMGPAPSTGLSGHWGDHAERDTAGRICYRLGNRGWNWCCGWLRLGLMVSPEAPT